MWQIGLALVLLLGEAPQVRVFISDRDSFESSGGFTASNGNGSGGFKAGVRRQNTEQIKTFAKECPAVTVTSAPDKADFIVIWDVKTWAQTSWGGHQNEFTVYNPAGDLIFSGAAHKQTNAARDICKAVSVKKGATK